MDGHPVSRLQEGERQKLVKMEERLMERVVGQGRAIKSSPTPCGARRSAG